MEGSGSVQNIYGSGFRRAKNIQIRNTDGIASFFPFLEDRICPQVQPSSCQCLSTVYTTGLLAVSTVQLEWCFNNWCIVCITGPLCVCTLYNWCTLCITGAVCTNGGLNAEICAAQLSKPSISPAIAAECIGTEASEY
jgi:hypothetical protein